MGEFALRSSPEMRDDWSPRVSEVSKITD